MYLHISLLCLATATIGLGQNSFIAEGNLVGGAGASFTVEVSESGGRTRLPKSPVNADSSFRIEIPSFGQPLEFRIMNLHGDVVQVVNHTPQRGLPIELRLNGFTTNTSSSEPSISLKRLSFQPTSKSRRALSESQRLRTKGLKTESRAALEEIVGKDPGWFEAWVELGHAQVLLEENAAAADSLRKALAIDPNAAEIYPFLGFALLRSGQYEEAGLIAEKGLKLNPDSLKSKYLLGLAMASQSKEKLRAVAILEDVQSYYPDAMLPLASLLLQLHQFEASRDAAWRYLHMVNSTRAATAETIWRNACLSLRSQEKTLSTARVQGTLP